MWVYLVRVLWLEFGPMNFGRFRVVHSEVKTGPALIKHFLLSYNNFYYSINDTCPLHLIIICWFINTNSSVSRDVETPANFTLRSKTANRERGNVTQNNIKRLLARSLLFLSESTQIIIRPTRVFLLSSLSRNFDDQFWAWQPEAELRLKLQSMGVYI